MHSRTADVASSEAVHEVSCCDNCMNKLNKGCTSICFILLLPFVLILIILLILLSHNILSNIIFTLISVIVIGSDVSLYFNLGYIARNILHIIVLCIFRYPFDKFRVIYNISTSLSMIILSIYFKTSYYVIILSLITLLSEFWINSSKHSIKECENNLLRLLYYDNYHESYQRDKFKDIDDNIILENKFCNGISYFYIHLKSERDQKRDTMVVIHGYYSGKIFAAESIRILSRYYDLIIPDLPGNGLSDRLSWFSWILSCKLCNKSTLQIEQYFVDILDEFFIEIGIEKFHIMAHSFGGYLAALYVINHADKIKNNLILLSPVCLSNIDKPNDFGQYLKSNKSFLGLYMRFGWNRYCSMQQIARCLGPYLSLKFVKWRLSPMQHSYYWSDIDKQFNDEIYRYWFKYTYNMYLSPTTSLFQRIFYDFIGPYLYSNDDISQRFIHVISKYNINTFICHGDNDWVSTSGANYVYNEIQKRLQSDININVNVNVKIIENCTHQILMNQPVKITNLIHQFIQQNV